MVTCQDVTLIKKSFIFEKMSVFKVPQEITKSDLKKLIKAGKFSVVCDVQVT